MGFEDHRLAAALNLPAGELSSFRSGDAGRGASPLTPGRLSARVACDVVRALDVGLLTMAWFAACCAIPGSSQPGLSVPAMAAAIVAACWILAKSGAYDFRRLQSVRAQFRSIVVALVATTGGLIAYGWSGSGRAGVAVGQALAWALVSGGTLAVSRLMVCPYLDRAGRAGRLARRVAIIGLGPISDGLVARLRDEPQAWSIVGIYDDRLSRLADAQAGVPVLGAVRDLERRARKEKIDVIVIALPLSAVARIADILEQVSSAVADICLTTDLAGARFGAGQPSCADADHAMKGQLLPIKHDPLKDWRSIKKAVFDRALGALLLVVSSPALALIALAVRVESPGPAIFRQPRLGFNNELFFCYKFRTMRVDATDLLADRQTSRGDTRLTRIGPYLRRFSLDELPQLVNVLQGTMSLVGPRPHAPNTKAADRPFADVVAQYATRHRVKPGITGWAQINGWRGETSTVEQIEGRVAHDLYYVDNWSLAFDVRIIVLTIVREIWRKGVF